MLQPRQQYGLGSLVKSAVKGVTGAVKGVASGIKDFAKSDLGKTALIGATMFGVPGTQFGGLFGRAGFGGAATGLFGKAGIGAMLSGIPGASKAASFLGGEKTLGKTLGVFAGGSLLGGLLSKAEQGDPEAMQVTRDVGALRNYLTEGYTNLGYSAEEIPALVEKDLSEYSSIGGYAVGGRVQYGEGSPFKFSREPEPKTDLMKAAEKMAEEKGIPINKALKMLMEKNFQQDVTYRAMGGRIGYAGGGRDETPEEKMFREMKNAKVQAAIKLAGEKNIGIGKAMAITNSDDFNLRTGKYEGSDETIKRMLNMKAYGGRIGYMAGTPEGNAIQASGIMNLPLSQNKAGVTELDLRKTGGFIPPVGVKEKADDIPAMLSNNEFVFTADAVRGMGNGNVNLGAQRMYDMMKKLEKGGRV